MIGALVIGSNSKRMSPVGAALNLIVVPPFAAIVSSPDGQYRRLMGQTERVCIEEAELRSEVIQLAIFARGPEVSILSIAKNPSVVVDGIPAMDTPSDGPGLRHPTMRSRTHRRPLARAVSPAPIAANARSIVSEITSRSASWNGA